MHVENEWVKTSLNDFLGAIPSDYPYFALGSLALLSYTANNYSRQIRDIDVELYPGLGISMPESAVQTTRYQGIEFQAVSPETLFCIYNFGLKTWGALVKTRIEQRRRDLAALRKIVQPYALTRIADNIHLKIGRSRIKIPSKLITT